jgi:RHS repeat-associated protein
MVDADGNVTGGTPADHTWSTAYDALDRVTSETDPLGHATAYTYDGAGHRLTIADKNSNVTSYTYDAAGNLATVAQKPDPSGQPTLVYTTTITRDDNGNATAVTQGNGVVTSYSYDALNRMTSMTTHPATGTDLVTAYTLDAVGNVTNRHTADGVDTAYTFDNLNRLTQIAATGLSTISYAYDELSRRTSMTDVTGTTTYSYDRMGRLTQAAQPNGTVSYAYDRDSNRTTLTYPGSSSVTYSFSDAGRLSSLTDWGSRTTSYTYSAPGLAKTVTLPNSMVTTYTYDRAQRLTNLSNVISSTTITSHAYTLDSVGNRTALSEFVSGITSGSSDSFGFSYDGLERLTAVTTTNAETFTLDGASNITARTGPSKTFAIDNSNRPTSDGTNTLTWSSADRLTGRGSDSFADDPLDRLTSSTVSSTSRTYAYNGDGLLQSRTTGASTVNLLWDSATSPSRLLISGSDKIVYGLGPLYSVNGSTVTTYARDGQKSVRAELNGSTVNSSFRYRAYGEIAQSNAASAPSILGYAGQLLDPSGLYYMRARWYDAANARFLSRDALANMDATSGAFGYTAGNPLTFYDPTGASPVDENDKPLPPRRDYWKPYQDSVARQVESEMSANGEVANLQGRRLRNWLNNESVADANGRYGLPDNQTFAATPKAGSDAVPSRIIEAGTGGPSHLVQKVDDTMRYVEMAGDAYPGSAPRVELRFQLRIRGAGPIGGVLMFIDTYIQWLDMMQQEHAHRYANS